MGLLSPIIWTSVPGDSLLFFLSEEVNLVTKHLVMDPCRPDAPLLHALRKAPALLASCNTAGVLTALRAVSRTSRRLATSSVTTVTLQLGNTSQLDYLLPIMQASQLTKLRLLLDSAFYNSSHVKEVKDAAAGMGSKWMCTVVIAS